MTATLSRGTWSCPDSELILPITASRKQWLAARRAGIGGSEMGALIGINPYSTPYDVWLDKIGKAPEQPTTKRMQRGTMIEPIIADEFASEQGLTFRRAGLQRSRQFPHLFGNPDRLSSDGGGVEIKRTDSYGVSKQILAGNPPEYWLWQCLTYLAVTGRPHWWLVAMLPLRDDLWFHKIEADDPEYRDQIAAIGPLVETWWTTHVEGNVPPELGAPYAQPEVSAGIHVEALFPAKVLADRARWLELKEIVGEAESEIDQIKGRIGEELGSATELRVDSQPVAKRVTRKGSSLFDRKRLKAERPEVEAEFSYTGAPSSWVAVIPPKGLAL